MAGKIVERDRMSNLLRKLQTETFLFSLRNPRARRRRRSTATAWRWSTTTRWKWRCPRSRASTTSSSRLSAQGIDVVSMRNKVNRLEEMFMRLVENRSP